ncbi:MAG: hypothetical protein WCR47_07730, partial [Desulfoplanes sp.]
FFTAKNAKEHEEKQQNKAQSIPDFSPFAFLRALRGEKELNSDNLFENYGSETGFGLDPTAQHYS